MRELLESLYSPEQVEDCLSKLEQMIAEFQQRNPDLAKQGRGLQADQNEVLLIAYGDQVTPNSGTPLQGLKAFLDEQIPGLSGLHILPHFPYSSDDGFSVIDYREVDPALGSWEDVHGLADGYNLMFDAVVNHISAQSPWFKEFLGGKDSGYFYTADPKLDHSEVIRPRTHPLLTPFDTPQGEKHLWTTFSTDQIDLDFSNPELLLEMTSVLLEYAEHGARYLRLDAIGFLWKELGTTCMHLTQTHNVVKLWREIFDQTAPAVSLVPEINGTYEENAPYFGDGANEAQMVYNFPLPPMVLHAYYTGDATHLNRWLSTLATPSEGTTLFNFLSSHDGIGVRPVDNLLPRSEVEMMVEKVRSHGGQVSNRLVEGKETPYEMNITFHQALTGPDEPVELGVARMRSSHALLLSLAGVPGIYFNSVVGCPNWDEGFAETGRNRTLNRRKFRRDELDALLADDPQMSGVHKALVNLIQTRRTISEFHPQGAQEILNLHPAVVAVKRQDVTALTNVSAQEIELELSGQDLLTGTDFTDKVMLPPYGALWLRR